VVVEVGEEVVAGAIVEPGVMEEEKEVETIAKRRTGKLERLKRMAVQRRCR
jgi:hypothetical protein